MTDKSKKGAGGLVLKDDKFVYVPILDTIQQLVTNDAIRNEVIGYRIDFHVKYGTCFKVMKSHVSYDNFLRYICDGWQAKEHEESINHGDNIINLKVLAYFDEIEVCNPLGSHSKVHKLGIVVFSKL